MTKTIDVLELASELANLKLIEFSNSLSKDGFEMVFPNGIQKTDENGVVYYTEEAQDIFNEYYDDYLILIDSCTIKEN
jgi:hypothetical protein